MSAAINISGADPESTKVLSTTIMDIISCPHTDEKTKQLALKTLSKGVKAPKNTNISNCNIVTRND